MPATYTDRIDGLTTSVAVKAPVVAATNGALAWPLTGLQTIDSISVAEGDRVLVKDQADTRQNGIWNASALAWSRVLDWDGARDAVNGTLVHQAGTGQYWEAVSSDQRVIPGASHVTFDTVFSTTEGPDDDVDFPAGGPNTVSVPAGKGLVTVDCTLINRTIIFNASDTSLKKNVSIQKTSEANILTINDGASDVYPENSQQRVLWRRAFGSILEIGRSQ